MRDISTQLITIWVLVGRNGYFVVRREFGKLVGIFVLNVLWRLLSIIVLFSWVLS
jgi:hypothetical protein